VAAVLDSLARYQPEPDAPPEIWEPAAFGALALEMFERHYAPLLAPYHLAAWLDWRGYGAADAGKIRKAARFARAKDGGEYFRSVIEYAVPVPVVLDAPQPTGPWDGQFPELSGDYDVPLGEIADLYLVRLVEDGPADVAAAIKTLRAWQEHTAA
jgi:hypothetical protein